MNRQTTLLGAAAGIAVVTVVARAAGFGRTVVFTQTVGTGCLGDTYQAANAIPNVVFEVVAGGALASLVVPVLAGAVAVKDTERASRTTSALLTWTVLVLVPVVVAGWLAAPTMVRLLLGEDPACGQVMLDVATSMLRVFMPQVLLYGVAVVLSGVLQAHHRFLWPALAPLVSSVVVASAYLAYAAQGEQPLASLSTRAELILTLGTTLGVAALALSLLAPLRGTGLRVRPSLTFPDGLATRVKILALAGIAVLTAQQIALVVALRLAAGGEAGDIAVFTVALTLFLVPWAVLAVPVATSAFPRLAATTGSEEFAALARRSTQAVLVLTAAGAAALFAAADPIAALLGAGQPMAGAIRGFAPGLVGYGLLALITRTLYARGQGRAAATASVLGWLTVVIADLALVQVQQWERPTALALGNAVGMTVAAVALLAILHRSVPGALTGTARTAAVGLTAATIIAAVSLTLPTSPQASVLVSLALAAALGFAALTVSALALWVGDRGTLKAVRGG